MDSFKSLVPEDKLKEINQKVHDEGVVDRKHLLEFLGAIPSSDGNQIIQEVKNWLRDLHNDPYYDKVIFPPGHIDAVISDLVSYGRVQPLTILQYQEDTAREPSTP